MKRKSMIGILIFGALGLGTAATYLRPVPGEFKASILTMGLGFTAKALCSCLFVSEHSEEQCRSYASIDQVSPDFIVDLKNKAVTSKFIFWSAKASFVDSQIGCFLE